MKAFKFTLEAVQTLRHRQERQAMEGYVRALLARQQAFDHLESLRGQIKLNQQEMNRLIAAGCTASQALQISHYQQVLDKQLEERLIVLANMERRLNAAFQAMLLARQQRKIVETYRKKQHVAHQRAALREEQKLLDDLAARRSNSILAWNSAEALS